MLFADQVFSKEEVEAVLQRTYAPTMFFRAHDSLIRSIVQTSEKAQTLMDEVEEWDCDEEIRRTFAKAVRAPKIYVLGGKSKITDAFGEDTPIGWSYDYWLRLYENVKDASLDYLLDIGIKNGGRLPLIESQEFMSELMELSHSTSRLYQGYMDAIAANDYFMSKKDEPDGPDLEKYARRMMSGIYVMLHNQTGMPSPEPDPDDDDEDELAVAAAGV